MKLSKVFLGLTILLAVIALVMLVMGYGGQTGLPVILALVFLALYAMGHPLLKGFAFTFWVFVGVAWSLYYPGHFMTWSGYDLALLITPLIQIIMFGMGTTLNIKDFVRVAKMPLPIIIGIVLQFGAKPVVGLLLAKMLGLEGEVAAGVILIGSVPGGVASNLMTYLASGDVALSVTMTSFSTLTSPIMTPLAMKYLAGAYITIEFLSMMMSIINMIIVPIVAGIIANKILYSKEKWSSSATNLFFIGFVCTLIAVLTIVFNQQFTGLMATLKGGIILGFLLLGLVGFTKLIVNVIMKSESNWMDATLPKVSMFGIVFIIAIITSRSQEDLVTVGVALLIASIGHNFIGYILGYWVSKLFKLPEKTCRTVSIEVGLQNGGMASGLAMDVLQSAQAALAPAIYGPWMNISGSVLATWWHRKPIKGEESGSQA